jgi:integrase
MQDSTIGQGPAERRRPKSVTGIEVRHSRDCRTQSGGGCNCKPTYRAEVWSKRDRRKIRKSFPTLAAAKGWRIDAMKAVRDKRLRAASPHTLAEEAAEWIAGANEGRILNKRQQRYKRAAVANYERSLRIYVLPEIGDRRLADIELADLLELKEQLHGRGCGASTVRNAFTPLQSIYRRARQLGTVPVDPTSDLDLPTPGARDRAASVAEALALLQPLQPVEVAVYATAFFAGLRRGEMRALRVGDVDLAAATISVERGWDDVLGAIEPKTESSTRKVFLANALRPHVEPLVASRDAGALLFGYTDATPFDPRAMGRKCERAWKIADKRRAENELGPLVRYTPHEGRHSFATWLDDAGVSEAFIARALGHSARTVTRRYIHRHELTGAREQFDAYVAGRTSGKVIALQVAS